MVNQIQKVQKQQMLMTVPQGKRADLSELEDPVLNDI